MAGYEVPYREPKSVAVSNVYMGGSVAKLVEFDGEAYLLSEERAAQVAAALVAKDSRVLAQEQAA